MTAVTWLPRKRRHNSRIVVASEYPVHPSSRIRRAPSTKVTARYRGAHPSSRRRRCFVIPEQSFHPPGLWTRSYPSRRAADTMTWRPFEASQPNGNLGPPWRTKHAESEGTNAADRFVVTSIGGGRVAGPATGRLQHVGCDPDPDPDPDLDASGDPRIHLRAADPNRDRGDADAADA